MFTMAKIRNGDSYLETHLSANDYYSEKESVAGIWAGSGAEFLGIRGNEISSKDKSFEHLRNNQHPLTGEKLTKRNKTTRLPSFNEARKSLCQQLRLKGKLRDGFLPSVEEIEAHRSKMSPICNRIAFYDFQCGCSKSVSIMALVGNDDRLRIAHEEAVVIAFQELELLAARRVDFIGKKHLKFTGNIAAAIFQHDSSRSLDPQLHTHCVVANATFDSESREWFSLTEFEMLKAIRYGGKVYQNELARKVKELGYNIVSRRNEKGLIEGFEIEGISEELMKRFSKRRVVIEQKIEEFKIKVGRDPSPAEISVITRESRESKDLRKISTHEVRANQLSQLSEEEKFFLLQLKMEALKLSSQRAEVKMNNFKIDTTVDVTSSKEEKALQDAMHHVFERSSVLQSHQILAEALNQNLGFVELELLKHLLKKPALENKNSDEVGKIDLVKLSSDLHPLTSLFTSTEHLHQETWIINYINTSCGKRPKLLFEEPITSDWLAKEQSDAVKFVCSNKDAVCAIRGIAGAGKTTMLKELHSHLEKVGQKMLYLAPTASAVEVLKEEGFDCATTVSEYLIKAEHEPWTNAVIVIDEAGLQSTRQGYETLKLAQKQWQRIVLVGDSKQHVSVEAGDFLRLIETHSKMKSNELKNIRRQSSHEYRHAISLMAEGNAGDALEHFNQMGWINESGAQYLEDAAKNYLIRSEYGPKMDSVIAVAPTWSENITFTDAIRKGLKGVGFLKEGVMHQVIEPLGWTRSQKCDVSNYRAGLVVTFAQDVGVTKKGTYLVTEVEKDSVHIEGGKLLPFKKISSFDVGERKTIEIAKGDKILLRANDKKIGLTNGTILNVEHIESNGSIVTKEGIIVPSEYRQFTHGYVVTSHKSQGKTADHVVIAAAKLDEKAAYVATSRGRVSCDIYTPETDRLISMVRHSSTRLTATDIKGKIFIHSPHPSRRQSLKIQSLGSRVIHQFQKATKKLKFLRQSMDSSFVEPIKIKAWKEYIDRIGAKKELKMKLS